MFVSKNVNHHWLSKLAEDNFTANRITAWFFYIQPVLEFTWNCFKYIYLELWYCEIWEVKNNDDSFYTFSKSLIFTIVSCDRVCLSLTTTTDEVQPGPDEAKTLSRVHNVSCWLLVQSLFRLNRVWARSVAGCRLHCRAIRRHGAVGAARGLMDRRWMMVVEDIFSQRLVADRGVPKEVAAQRGRLRLKRSQTLTLGLRSETLYGIWKSNWIIKIV